MFPGDSNLEKASRDVENPQAQRNKRFCSCTLTKSFLFAFLVFTSILAFMAFCLVKNQDYNEELTLKMSMLEDHLSEAQHILSSANMTCKLIRIPLTKHLLDLLSVPKTCQGYEGRNGILVIDPLKSFKIHSRLEVNCSKNGLTMVQHDKPKMYGIKTLEWLNSQYTLTLAYNASLSNIKDLLEVSEECYQDVQFS